MLFFFLLLPSLALAAAPPQLPSDPPCTLSTSDYTYDLRPLINHHTDYIIRPPPLSPTDPTLEYRLNVCRNLVTGPDLSAPPQIAVMGAFMQSDNLVRGYSLGSYETKPYLVRPPSQEGPPTLALSYRTGSPCPAHPQVPMTALIEFICDKDVHPHTGDFGPRYVGVGADGCATIFSFPSPYSCPVSARPRGFFSALALLIPVFIILALVFLLASFSYRRFVQNQRGPDQLPNYTSGPIETCLDFYHFSLNSVKSVFTSRQTPREGYGRVHLSNQEF